MITLAWLALQIVVGTALVLAFAIFRNWSRQRLPKAPEAHVVEPLPPLQPAAAAFLATNTAALTSCGFEQLGAAQLEGLPVVAVYFVNEPNKALASVFIPLAPNAAALRGLGLFLETDLEDGRRIGSGSSELPSLYPPFPDRIFQRARRVPAAQLWASHQRFVEQHARGASIVWDRPRDPAAIVAAGNAEHIRRMLELGYWRVDGDQLRPTAWGAIAMTLGFVGRKLARRISPARLA